MMSFGVGISDLDLIYNRIYEAVRRYHGAPREIEAQRKDAASFAWQLRTHFITRDVFLGQAPEATNLEKTAQECLVLLGEIQKRLDEGNPSEDGRISSMKRFVKRVTFNPIGHLPLWTRVEHCISRISLELLQDQRAFQAISDRARHLDSISKYYPDHVRSGLAGTCAWIIDSDILQSWKLKAGEGLLCHGRPGGGKTTIASMVANQLAVKYRHVSDVGIACVYLGLGNPDLRTLDEVQRAILRQLCEKHPHSLKSVSELSVFRDTRQHDFGDDGLLKSIVNVLTVFSRVFLIVDGIDEFGTNMTCTRRLLRHLKTIQERSKANLFLTSVVPPEALATWPKLEIWAHDDDIAKYVNSMAVDLSRGVLENGHIPKWIVQDIIDISDGMFLVAYFLMREIGDMNSFGQVRSLFRDIQAGIACQNVSKDSGVLQAIYAYITNKIDRRSPRLRARAKNVILWVSQVTRRLRSFELCHAFEIITTEEVEIRDLIQDTRGLVTQLPESDIIQLHHPTARMYFERIWKADLPSANANIAKTLLACLISDDGTKRGIYEYAATSWAFHVLKAPDGAPLVESVMKFLRDWPNVYESCEILLRQYCRGRQPTAISGLHLAAHFGLLSYLNMLVSEGANIDDLDENGETPLLWAARNRQEEAVAWLLELGADIDVRDFELKSALHYAVIHRWEGPLQLLLQRNARVTADIENMTPVHYAVQSGWIKGLRILFNAQDLVNTRVRRLGYHQEHRDGRRVYELVSDDQERKILDASSEMGLTPLHFGALNGFREPVRFLLDRGAIPTTVSEYGETPLHLAICRGLRSQPGWCTKDAWGAPESRIESTLDFIDISDEEYNDMGEIIFAEISSLLVDLLSHPDTNINARTSDGSQALHLVSYGNNWRSTRLVKLLLEHGADPSGRNFRQQTPLLLACASGDSEAARLLLDHGADVTVVDDERRGVLHYALSESVMRDCTVLIRLLKQGAEINSVDSSGMTPLTTYISHWFLLKPKDTIKLLLDWQADISYRSPDRGLGLGHIYANSIKVDAEVLKLLANAGLDLGTVDGEGQTILHHSARAGSLTIPAIKYLVSSEVGLSLDTVDLAGKKALEYARDMSKKKHHRNMFDSGRWRRTEKIMLDQMAQSV